MEVIPAINAASYKEAREQFQKVSATGARKFHLDIVDGMFAPNVTWGSSGELTQLTANNVSAQGGPASGGQLTTAQFEIHLMVANPEEAAETWCASGVGRVIVHAEAIGSIQIIVEACKQSGTELMVAINPETPVDALMPYFGLTRFFQVLAVSPGKAGQTFNPEAIEKIELLKEKNPDGIIEIDGGVNPDTARQAKRAGANVFVSASYIAKSEQPRAAYQALLKAVQ